MNRFSTRYIPGEQQKVTTRLNIIVRPQMNDGAIDELRYLKVETIKPEILAILEDRQACSVPVERPCSGVGNNFRYSRSIMRLQE